MRRTQIPERARGTLPLELGADLPALQARLEQLAHNVEQLDQSGEAERASTLALEATKVYLGMQRVRLQLQRRTLSLQAADLLRSAQFATLARDIELSRRALTTVQDLRARLRAYLREH